MKPDHLTNKPIIYRAPYVVPVSGPVLADGAVLVVDGRIAAVDSFAGLRSSGAEIVDLEQQILTPALVNCHAHLELSYLADLDHEEQWASGDITAWIRTVLASRSQPADPNRVMAAASTALDGQATGGVALVADIGNSIASRGIGRDDRPRVNFFLELLGLAPEAVEQARQQLAGLDGMACTAHAPHSTHPEMIRGLKERAGQHGYSFPIHVAESAAELEFLRTGEGPFRDFIAERLGRVDFFEPPGCGAVEYLERLGVLDNKTICVHAVHISEAEATLIATRQAKVCLCPGSNRFLGVGKAPLPLLLKHGILPALGTDSLASNQSLNLWREMRLLQEDHPGIPPAQIFAMATKGGAEALGAGTELGSLEMGKAARILAVAYDGPLVEKEVYSYLVTAGNQRLRWLE